MNNKKVLIVALGVFVPAAFIQAADRSEATISIAAGMQRQISVSRGLQRVAIGDPSVADVLVTKKSGLLLVAKSPGQTNLLVWENGLNEPKTYAITVTDPVSGLLEDGSNIKMVSHNGMTVIAGNAPDLLAHRSATSRVNGVAGGKSSAIIDKSIVNSGGVVQVDVKVVEFSKSVLKDIGFNLFTTRSSGFAFGLFSPSSLQSITFPPITFSSTPPVASAFNIVAGSNSRGVFGNLGILESNGMARVLAEPSLVALSGQSASFLAGGEIPVPVPQSLGTVTIQYKPYGIGLTLTPTVLSRERIALKVAPEASDLDFARSININGVSVPGIITRRADTTVELGDGDSYVIGGLVSRDTVANVDKVPLLGDLPIIGSFFKRLNYEQNDKELVIIVTPHLVSAIGKGAPLPPLPGENSEQRDGPVWSSFLKGALSSDVVPGFSR
ncbi:type II and III secretion system protein family protein [Crenobacter sp. SG2303]|uniref:Type II and III secretion system protein family protein n=1 Tax=Crenobacter oryzisoli TaxID=3056844 RepID=A0ABT7XTI5_9NEIS|nr:type II and III secretion system protein family protein [Crenobacter sp. SG2303]MDN0077112.1 type II and III secretion system protein family protein [Crenobacter sp. SG2303]